MRIFALETDINKVKERFCKKESGECEVLMTYYHGLSFFFAILREIFITVVLVSIGIVGVIYAWPQVLTWGALGTVWVVFAFFNILKAYIDWCYDFILVTTDKVVLVDQTSFFQQEIKPIHLENIGSITMETQFMDIFPFGTVSFHLKEGEGGDVIEKKYVPRARELTAKISDVVMEYQRRGSRADRQHEPAPIQAGVVDVAVETPVV